MKSFLETLNYSSSNEDGRSETKALLLKESDSVICITGSGARTLDILTEPLGEIISVDVNPCQNFLLDLKITAIRRLEYDEFLRFLGTSPSKRRSRVYRGLRQSLPSGARGFWDAHPQMIEEGILYAGRWERYFRRLAHFMSFVRPRLRSRLFSAVRIEEQARLWHDEWDSFFWRVFLRVVSSRVLWRHAFGDPGFFLYTPHEFSVYDYLSKRLASAVECTLLKESPFARFLFFGRYEEGVLPLHLQRRHHERLRSRLDRIRIVTGSLLDCLAKYGEKRFDKYSLSDFGSYTDIAAYEYTWKQVVRTASEGARVCERQFLVKRDPPADIAPFLVRDEMIERELGDMDDSIFYSFVVATIRGHA